MHVTKSITLNMKLSIFLILSAVFLSPAIGASLNDNESIKEKIVELEEVLEDIMDHAHVSDGASQLAADQLADQLAASDEFSDSTLFKNDNSVKEKLAAETKEKMLLYTNDIRSSINEITAMGGKVTIQLGSNLLVAQVPIDKKSTLKSASTHVPKSASQETLKYVKAYWKSVEAQTMGQPEIHRWTDKTAPKSLANAELPKKSYTKSTMTGTIAVVILIASGPGSLAISSDESSHIISEVFDGLSFWEEKAPVPLHFIVYCGLASINLPNNRECPSAPACHDGLASATVQYFGFQNQDEVGRHIKAASGADGVYLAFFTKYKLWHFAYAYRGSGPTYMEYSNDGWGPDQIDRVFAHETGHVFNSPDEYGRCDCTQAYGRGMCTAKNENCVGCVSGGEVNQENCIMDTNQFEVCEYTRKHIGWCD